MLVQSTLLLERATILSAAPPEASPEAAAKLPARPRPLVAVFAPVSPYAAISLAVLGHSEGAARQPVLSALPVALSGPNGTLTKLVRVPAKALQAGGEVLAQQASILATALLQVARGSAHEVYEGNLPGVWNVTLQAMSEAQVASHLVTSSMSAAASSSLGIVSVCVGVAFCWGLELYLGRMDYETKVREQPDAAEPTAPFLHGLSFARYLMSWHMVLNNFCQMDEEHMASAGNSTFIVFARWGQLAIPWFLLVSGFSHSYAKMVGPRPDSQEDWFQAMVRRVGSWYPIYLLVLIWCALRSFSTEAEDWAHFMADALLVHGLIWEETAFPDVVGDWWLCFLMVYLVLWFPLHQAVSTASNSVLWTIFTISTMVVLPLAIFEWFFPMEIPIWECVNFFPAFVFGQALASWFVRHCMQETRSRLESHYAIRPAHEMPMAGRFGATLSFLILGVLFFSFSPDDDIALLRQPVKPLLLKGGLLPLFGMMVVGLSAGVDPVARLLARAPLRWAEKVAFMNFILQVPIHNTVQDLTGWSGLSWTFTGSLLIASALGYALLERPWRRIWGAREK